MSSKSAAGRAAYELFVALLEFLNDHPRAAKEEIYAAVPHSSKKLWYMEQKKYIKRFGVSYALTEEGKQLLSEDRIWKLAIPAPAHWDNKWHLVLFDIPAHKHKYRDLFRMRLREFGLVLYQNSVWVYPYPLEDTIRPIADFYLLSGCVSFIIAEQLTAEDKLRKHFKLS
jgi:phenylacetic acid degradation operon negative regulatory protein